MSGLISIIEAASNGIERIRLPRWLVPEDHIKIDIIDGKPGPWTHLYAPFNMECNKRDPVDILFTEMDYEKQEWEAYTGPIAGSPEYKAAQDRYTGALLSQALPAQTGGGASVKFTTLDEAVSEIVRKHDGVRAAARATGVDKAFISRLMAGKRTAPSDETLKALGLRPVPLYEVLKDTK